MRFWPDSAKSSTPKIQVQEQRYDDIAFSHSSLQVTSQVKGLQLIINQFLEKNLTPKEILTLKLTEFT